MTREQALAASRALDAVDGFQAFMEEIDKAVIDAEDFALFNPDFKIALYKLMEDELARLNQELEDL